MISKEQLAQQGEPVFILSTGEIVDGERDDWDIAPNCNMDEFCDKNPGKKIGLYAGAAPAYQPVHSGAFAKWYWKACDSSQPHDWMKAALAAQRILATSRPDESAPAPAAQPLTDAQLRDQQEQPFEEWWEKEWQFSRAGGGQYEKTFAWNAWIASRKTGVQQ